MPRFEPPVVPEPLQDNPALQDAPLMFPGQPPPNWAGPEPPDAGEAPYDVPNAPPITTWPWGTSERGITPVADKPDLLEQTYQQYPLARRYADQIAPLDYKPWGQGQDYLEVWDPNEVSSPGRPRPFPQNKWGFQVFRPEVNPEMLMGDIASHMLRQVDPIMKGYYDQFVQQWYANPSGRGWAKLMELYNWSRLNHGEKRPFSEWARDAGMPQMFRGHLFHQTPKWFDEQFYTPQMLQLFDQIDRYMRGK